MTIMRRRAPTIEIKKAKRLRPQSGGNCILRESLEVTDLRRTARGKIIEAEFPEARDKPLIPQSQRLSTKLNIVGTKVSANYSRFGTQATFYLG